MRSTLSRTLSAMLVITILAGVAAYSAGDATDPVLSLSYITDTFVPQVVEEAQSAAEDAVADKLAQAFDPVVEEIDDRIGDAVLPEVLSDELVAAAQLALAEDGWYRTTVQNVRLTLSAGQRIRFRSGAEFTVVSGGAVLDGSRAAEFVQMTSGGGAYVGLSAAQNSTYLLADDRIAGLYTANGCDVIVRGYFQIIPAYKVKHTDTADLLAAMDLFRGTGNGYSLERQATRLEAIIMFLRLIGEEEAALAYTGSHPFTDVPYWADGVADKYIAYAYSKGYTNGVSATRSGASDPVTAEQYMTFVLRALGYSSETDFDWTDALSAAVGFGVLTAAERDSFLRRGFYRDGVAYVSWRALFAQMPQHGMILLDKLVADGVITAEQAEQAAAAKPSLIE